jgi:hypothetical protein
LESFTFAFTFIKEMKKSKVFLCREEQRWEFLVLHVRRTGFVILLRSPLEVRIMSARDVWTVRQRQNVNDSLYVLS